MALYSTVGGSFVDSKLFVVLALFIGYLALVRLLRWNRYKEIHRRYARRIDNLTPDEAQDIVHVFSMYDFPLITLYSVSFALFKTYAIPSISKILANTKEFSSKDLVSKRYADTEILITTWFNCPMSGYFDLNDKGTGKVADDPRGMIALARVNFLHSRYKILNDDYLYTLSLFIFEPISWARRFAWRELSPLECQAFFVYWVEIGNRMNIKDIPETLDEFAKWRDTYEAEHMAPASSNREVAGFTIDELLHSVPKRFGIKAFFTRIIICTLEEKTRVSMMQLAQPWYLHLLTKSILYSVGPFQRYLCLPRTSPKSLVPLGKPTSPYMHPERWQAKPWYKPQSTGLGALVDKFAVMIGYYDDLPGPKYKSEGYRLEEMGPADAEKSHHEEVMRSAANMLGCPISGVFAPQGH